MYVGQGATRNRGNALPYTNPNDIDTSVKLTNDQYKALVDTATKLNQLGAIDASNNVGLPAHLTVLATGYYTPAESLDIAYAFVRTRLAKRKAATLFAGYTGTPKAIWVTRNGLPADMGGKSKAYPSGNPENSYYPLNAGKRKGLPSTAVIHCQKHKARVLQCKVGCKFRLLPNGARGSTTTASTASAPSGDKAAQAARRKATNAAKRLLKLDTVTVEQAEPVIAQIAATIDGASKAYEKAANKRIADLKAKANMVADRGNGRTATATRRRTPAQQIATASTPAATPSG